MEDTSAQENQKKRRKQQAIKFAEKRFRVVQLARRDKITFIGASIGFLLILFLSVVRGRSLEEIFWWSSCTMFTIGGLCYALGTILLRCEFTSSFQRQHMRERKPVARNIVQTVPVENLMPGMELKQSAIAPDGRQMMLAGSVFNHEKIKALIDADIKEVLVRTKIVEDFNEDSEDENDQGQDESSAD
jgi:hypothetical protein